MFLLIDCNSFFCSVERVFQPHLKNKPLVVLSSNDGCIVARTPGAKKAGLPMGAPVLKWRDVIRTHNVQMRSSNFTLIGDFHRRVMMVIKSFNLPTQVYSIDEAFIEVDSFSHSELIHLGHEIRKKILQATDIPVSVGIGKTKTLSKCANFLAKQQKAGVSLMENLSALKDIPIEEVWGIGRKSSQKLRINYNINTAYDFATKADRQRVLKDFSILGSRTQEELLGIKHFKLNQKQAPRKGLLCSRSFSKKVRHIDGLRQALSSHITTASAKLRKQGSLCRRLTVFIRTSRHDDNPRRQSLSLKIEPGTADTLKLINSMNKMLTEIYEPHLSYKKSGIYLSDLIQQQDQQLNLFAQSDSSKQSALMKTVDVINAKHGKETIQSAQCGTNKFWKVLCEMKSPCYTTRFSELLTVKA